MVNTVSIKEVLNPVNGKNHGGAFTGAKPMSIKDAVNILKWRNNSAQLPTVSLLGRVFRRWPFFYDPTGASGRCDRRIRFLLTDELEEPGQVRFYVTCFGKYAEE